MVPNWEHGDGKGWGEEEGGVQREVGRQKAVGQSFRKTEDSEPIHDYIQAQRAQPAPGKGWVCKFSPERRGLL